MRRKPGRDAVKVRLEIGHVSGGSALKQKYDQHIVLDEFEGKEGISDYIDVRI